MKRMMLILLAAGALAAHGEARIWNRNWEFRRGDETAWRRVHLPHSFDQPYFLSRDFYTGDGFYRKRLTAEETRADNLFLDFEGAFQFCEVWLDGVKVGEHRTGYTGFRIDLTPALRRGAEQEVLVKVNNEWNATTAPRAGEHIFTGRINRNVRLVSEGASYIAFNGLKVTTPQVSETEATLVAEVAVVGDGEVTWEFDGTRVTTRARRHEWKVANPRLWSPDAPNLYPLRVTVGRSVATANVGFRWFAFTKDRGFLLNGKPLYLVGANVHQDSAGWGDGRADASQVRDVRLMKEAGFNFIRGSHYPHAPAFLDACDRLGVLYWSEGGVWGMGGVKEDDTHWNCSAIPSDPAQRPAFLASAELQVREMIADAKNHPSVFAWSVCNEPFFVTPGGDNLAASRDIVRHLLAVVRECDGARAAAVGGAQRGGFDALGEDLIGYNGDGARLFRDPPAPNLVAEFGSKATKRPGRYASGWDGFTNDRPAWRSGAAVWCGFDHGSIWPAGARMGIVDHFRVPKRAWHWYRENLRGIPPPAWPRKERATRLALETDTPALAACDGTCDALVTVRLTDESGATVDDARPVALRILSGPGVFPTGRTLTFTPDGPADIIEGVAAIALRAHHAGVTVIEATADGLAPARLELPTHRGACTDADAAWDETDVSRRDAEAQSGVCSLQFAVCSDGQEVPRPFRAAEKAARPQLQTANCKLQTPLCASASLRETSSAPNLALNRPCNATSGLAAAPDANDGDATTAWTPDATDPAPAWTLDLEFEFVITRMELDATPGASVAVSRDGTDWTTVVDGAFPATPVHYLRVAFPSAASATLREVRLY